MPHCAVKIPNEHPNEVQKPLQQPQWPPNTVVEPLPVLPQVNVSVQEFFYSTSAVDEKVRTHN